MSFAPWVNELRILQGKAENNTERKGMPVRMGGCRACAWVFDGAEISLAFCCFGLVADVSAGQGVHEDPAGGAGSCEKYFLAVSAQTLLLHQRPENIGRRSGSGFGERVTHDQKRLEDIDMVVATDIEQQLLIAGIRQRTQRR